MKIAYALVLLLGLAASFQAQEIVLGGVVYDPNGAVVPGVEIRAQGTDGKAFVGLTDPEGNYSIRLLPGTYKLKIDRAGFKQLEVDKYRVVNSVLGKMAMDFVIYGDNPEPCGYGGDCQTLSEITVDRAEIADKLPGREIMSLPRSPNFTGIVDYFGSPQKTNDRKGIICGVVRDEQGAAIPKAIVELKLNRESKVTADVKTFFKIVTNDDGEFRGEIPDGIYRIKFRADSFKSYLFKRFSIPLESKQCMTVKLNSAVPPHQIN